MTNKTIMKGYPMKKTFLVAVLALTILFAMTATAMADVSLGGNFQSWDAAHAGNGNGTPHVSFSTTSEKCSVCHSVHNAAGYVGIEGTANILLRSNRSNACTFCHVSATGVSTNRPYGTVAATYTTDTNTNHASTSASVPAYAGCASCHSVHGANTYTNATVVTSILRLGVADTDVPAGYAAGTKAEALTAFCSQCHAYFDPGYDTAANTTPSHIMTGSVAYGNTEADASVQGDQVAWASSATCTACHDAPQGGGNANSFPHYMPNNARFLQVAGYAGDTPTTTTEPSVDGACIKCHIGNAAATSGVGATF